MDMTQHSKTVYLKLLKQVQVSGMVVNGKTFLKITIISINILMLTIQKLLLTQKNQQLQLIQLQTKNKDHITVTLIHTQSVLKHFQESQKLNMKLLLNTI